MEFIIVCLMVLSCLVLLKMETDLKPVYLAILSFDIIASFVVLVIFTKTTLAGIFFFVNLLFTPWVVFYRLKEDVPLRCEKENEDKKVAWRDFLSGQ